MSCKLHLEFLDSVDSFYPAAVEGAFVGATAKISLRFQVSCKNEQHRGARILGGTQRRDCDAIFDRGARLGISRLVFARDRPFLDRTVLCAGWLGGPLV